MKRDRDQKTIKATQTMFDIVETIREHGIAGTTTIANELGRSKSTIHAHLITLEQQGYLIKQGNKYRIGLRFLTLGGHVQTIGEYKRLYKASRPEIDELAAETSERAQVTVEEHGYGIYLYQASGSRAVDTDSNIGTCLPLHSTAAGKAYLAHISETRVNSILDHHELSKQTTNTITDRDELFEVLQRIRDQGVAFDDGERVLGIQCVAAPITTDNGGTLGSVSISIPTKRADENRFRHELPEMVINAARVIGLNTEYS